MQKQNRIFANTFSLLDCCEHLYQESPITDLLCASNFETTHGFPTMLKRVQQLRQLVNFEGKMTQDSMALNNVEETAIRIRNNPKTTRSELLTFRTKVIPYISLKLSRFS